MNVLQSIFLGAVQGVTEFLPISSSGHLKIIEALFNLSVPDWFDVFLHLATLLAIVIYFWKQIVEFFQVLFRWIGKKPAPEKPLIADGLCKTEEAGRKTIIAVLITTVVTAVIGLGVEKIEDILEEKGVPSKFVILAIFTGFIITSGLLITCGIISRLREKNTDSESKAKPYNGITVPQALFVGLFQGIGTLPGISRSGSTIASGVYSGVDRKLAGDYSFIVSIPAILGAALLKAVKFVKAVKDGCFTFSVMGNGAAQNGTEVIGIIPVIAGFVASFAVGYLSLFLLMKIIKKGKLEWFAAYLIPVAILGFIFINHF
ncbi:MAG: undecaprenyl-diphosphate phosphatase [Treponema sp.]|uniref:undecaprenyl-diphosphate phosphatase n=1 Tax=Treponema sp. TaxID=166 RepID=UPI00298E15BF|nr:undecaprenyl-diphosphate phosphatase [Treponema sp.]MCQ2601311.1 undecaprenyl-diphosphate phosphatase [Treponema sp.]